MISNIYVTAAGTSNYNNLEDFITLEKMGVDAILIKLLREEEDLMASFPNRDNKPLKDFLEEVKSSKLNVEINIEDPKDVKEVLEIVDETDTSKIVTLNGLTLSYLDENANLLNSIDYFAFLSPHEVEFKELYFKNYCEEILKKAQRYGAIGVSLNHSMVTKMLSETAKKINFEINVSMCNNEMEIRHLLDIGIKRITTTNLRQLISIVNSQKNKYILA